MDSIHNSEESPINDEDNSKMSEDEEKPVEKFSFLGKLLDKLSLSECKSNSGYLGLEQIKTEIIAPGNDYFQKIYGMPVDISWEEASKKGDPVGVDFDIDYENIFENVDKLADVEKHLQLLYRPFIYVMDVSCRFNLYELGILMPNTHFEPGCHPSVSVGLHNPRVEVKIYAGGKMVASGLTADAARNALFKVIRLVQDMDYKPDIKSCKMNVVHASFCMPFKLDLELFSHLQAERVTTNFKRRPFITYTPENAGVRFAIFPTGFVVALHSTCHSETRSAIAALLPILDKVRNGYPTAAEHQGNLGVSDVSYKLLWEKKLDDDRDGLLLYS